MCYVHITDLPFNPHATQGDRDYHFIYQETEVGKMPLRESQLQGSYLATRFLPRSTLFEESVLLTTLISPLINSRQMRAQKEKQ